NTLTNGSSKVFTVGWSQTAMDSERLRRGEALFHAAMGWRRHHARHREVRLPGIKLTRNALSFEVPSPSFEWIVGHSDIGRKRARAGALRCCHACRVKHREAPMSEKRVRLAVPPDCEQLSAPGGESILAGQPPASNPNRSSSSLSSRRGFRGQPLTFNNCSNVALARSRINRQTGTGA